MHRKSILRAAQCDLKQLPIGALEAFVLSRVHGDSVAEDVAETTGLELDELLRVARRLAELGALLVDGERRKTKRPTAAPGRRPSGPHPHSKIRESLVPPAAVPLPRKHADVRSLGIGPREGFVLSQIDGVTSVADLREVTGLSGEELNAALRQLEGLGAVDLGRSKRRRSSAQLKAVRPAAPASVSSPESETCDLTVAERARIVETGARIEALDFYVILGVSRDADPKAIRRAYHEQARQFHPDRFFGRKLGPMRRPLERVFMRLTLAYETLSRRGKRLEYDATLPAQAMEPVAPQTVAPSKRSGTHKPPEPTKRSGTHKPPEPTRRGATQKPPAPNKRGATQKPPAPSQRTAPQPTPARVAPSPAAADRPEGERPRDGGRHLRSAQEHVDVFVRAAEEALDRDDVVAAANVTVHAPRPVTPRAATAA